MVYFINYQSQNTTPLKHVITLIFTMLFIISPASASLQTNPAAKSEKATQRLMTPPVQLSEPAKTATPQTSTSITQEAALKESPPQLPQPAGEAKTEMKTVDYAPTMVKTTTNYEFIVDASGSMNGPMGMRTKMNILKEALKEAISEEMPMIVNRNIGLRTYGSGYPSEENNCEDTKLEVPIGTVDIAQLNKAITSINAQGVTPLGKALLAAEEDMPAREDVDNVVILIADGVDSCNADPCEIASRIHQGPKKIIVHVVGFDLDQKSQESLKCIAKNSDGQFSLARNEAELKSSINQAINASLPYNLRIKVVAGATPLPSTLVVFKANTEQKIAEDKTSGIKFYKLPAGTYDIKIEYSDSVESPKPTKLLKGVEVQETSKAEQVVEFDLGHIIISASDQDGQPLESNFKIKVSGKEDIVADFKAGPDPKTLALTPGEYDISAEAVQPDGLVLTASAENVIVKKGETLTQKFEFQTGKLVLKGVDVLNQPIPIVFKIAAAGTDKEVAVGEAPKEGITIELSPSKYDVYVQLKETDVEQVPQTKLENVEIKAGETKEMTANIATGILKLSGKDSKGQFVRTNYEIKLIEDGEIVAKTFSESSPKEIHLAPGTYDVIAYDASTDTMPPPSIEWPSVAIKEGETVTYEAVFHIGSLQIAAMNSKKVLLPGTITVYRAGSDKELLVTSTDSSWKNIKLTPGLYDIKVEDTNSKEDPKPSVWFHDVEIVPNQSIAKEAVFRNGKIKILCLGKNDTTLICQFNLFAYGMDMPLISGETGKSWVEYEIPPGKYYIEAGYHDPSEEVLLKKWINVTINDNEILEQIMRF